MLMKDKVISIFCLVDDILKGMGHKEHVRGRVSDNEIIITSIVSDIYFIDIITGQHNLCSPQI